MTIVSLLLTFFLLAPPGLAQDERVFGFTRGTACPALVAEYKEVRKRHEADKAERQKKWQEVRRYLQIEHLNSWARGIKSNYQAPAQLKEIHAQYLSDRVKRNDGSEDQKRLDEKYLRLAWDAIRPGLLTALSEQAGLTVQRSSFHGRVLTINGKHDRKRPFHVNSTVIYLVMGFQGVYVVFEAPVQPRPTERFSASTAVNLLNGELLGVTEQTVPGKLTQAETLRLLSVSTSLRWTGREAGYSILEHYMDMLFLDRYQTPHLCRRLAGEKLDPRTKERKEIRAIPFLDPDRRGLWREVRTRDQIELLRLGTEREKDSDGLVEELSDEVSDLREYLRWVERAISRQVRAGNKAAVDLNERVRTYARLYEGVKKEFSSLAKNAQQRNLWKISRETEAEMLDALTQVFGRGIRDGFIQVYPALIGEDGEFQKSPLLGKSLLWFDALQNPVTISSYSRPDRLVLALYGSQVVRLPRADVAHPAKLHLHISAGRFYLRAETGRYQLWSEPQVAILRGGYRDRRASGALALAVELQHLSQTHEPAVMNAWKLDGEFPQHRHFMSIRELTRRLEQPAWQAGKPLPAGRMKEVQAWRKVRQEWKEKYAARFAGEHVFLSDFARKLWQKFEPGVKEHRATIEKIAARYRSGYEVLKPAEDTAEGWNQSRMQEALELQTAGALAELLNDLASKSVTALGFKNQVLRRYAVDPFPRVKIDQTRHAHQFHYVPGNVSFAAFQGRPLFIVTSYVQYQQRMFHPRARRTGSMHLAIAVGFDLLTGEELGVLDFDPEIINAGKRARATYDLMRVEMADSVRALRLLARQTKKPSESVPEIEKILASAFKGKGWHGIVRFQKEWQRYIYRFGSFQFDLTELVKGHALTPGWLWPPLEFVPAGPVSDQTRLALELSPYSPLGFVDHLIAQEQERK